MTIPSSNPHKNAKRGDKLHHGWKNDQDRVAAQPSLNSVIGKGLNILFKPAPDASVELDFEIFDLHDVQPNALIYQNGEKWTKEGVLGGLPYRVPQSIAQATTGANNQPTRIVRVVPVKPQEKIRLVCDKDLYDNIPATPEGSGLKPTRSPHSQSKIADATLAKWDGTKLVAATEADYDFTIFQISKSSPPIINDSNTPIYYAEAVYRGGAGTSNGNGGTVQVITRVVCDELEGCRIIEPILGNFFLVDLPITLVEKDANGNYTQFVTSSFSPLPINTDSYGHTITSLFSESSIHYRRTVFSNMGTIATHPLSEYEPIRPTYIGGELYIDTIFLWDPPHWNSPDNEDIPAIDILKKRVRGECRYWQEQDADGNTTPASPRHPLYLLRREPAITDSMVATRQAGTIRDTGYHWRYINGKHFGKGSPFDNSLADDFNALYFTPTAITEPLPDPADSNAIPTGNIYALDTKPFCIGTVPSLLTSIEFDGKVDILPFLTLHTDRYRTDLSNWIDTTYHHQLESGSNFAVQGFSFIENSQLAMRTVRDNITTRPFGSYGESFMYQQQHQLDAALATILTGYTEYALGATATGFGADFPIVPTATVISINHLPDPIDTSEGTTYRVGTGIGSYRYFRVISNTWVEANTSPAFNVPTDIQFAAAFAANWNTAFNAHFLEDITTTYQTVLSNIFTRFNELYPSVLHSKIVETLPSFIHDFNNTYTVTPIDGDTFFSKFMYAITAYIATDQSFNAAFNAAILQAYPDSDYPNTGKYASIGEWRQDKAEAAKTFLLGCFEPLRTAIERDIATLLKEATALAHAIIPPITITLPFSVSAYSPNINQPADPILQLRSYFDPVEYNSYTRPRVISLYNTQKTDPIKTQCYNSILADFTTEFSKYHDNTASSSWLFQTVLTATDGLYPHIESLYQDALSQTFLENTTNAIISDLSTSSQAKNLYKELALSILDLDISTEFQDWMSYLFLDGQDYNADLPITNPAISNASTQLHLTSAITEALTSAETSMAADPIPGSPNTSPLQTIIDSFYTSLYQSANPLIDSAIQAACVETGIPLSVNIQTTSLSELEENYPAEFQTLDTTARVGTPGNYAFYHVTSSGLANNSWSPMTVVTSSEFNQKLNARFLEFYNSAATSSFLSSYNIACNSYRTQFFSQYKSKLADTLISPQLSESHFGNLLTFLCDSIAITGYTIQTKDVALSNRYGNKSTSGQPQPLTFCRHFNNILTNFIDQTEQAKSPTARLQIPWQAVIAIACRDSIANTFHDTIRTTISSNFNPLFGASYSPKEVYETFPIPDFSFSPSFDVGNLDHVDFEAVNYPSLHNNMRTQIASLCESIAGTLPSLFSDYLSTIQDSTPPGNSTYPDGSQVTWSTLERDNILSELNKTSRTYFADVVKELWTLEKVTEYLSDTTVHPVSPQNWEWTKAPEKAQRHLPLALCPTADPCETLVPGEQCQYIERQATYTLPAVDMYNNPLYIQTTDENGILQDTEERQYNTFSFTYAEIIPPPTYLINPEGTGTNTFIKYTGKEVDVWTSDYEDTPNSTEVQIDFHPIPATADHDNATPMDGFGVTIRLDEVSSGMFSTADVSANKYGVVNDLKTQDPRGVFYKTDNCGRLYPCTFRIETAPYGYGIRATKTLGSYYAETDTCAPEFINDSATITRVFLDNRTFLAVHPSTQWHHTLTMCSEPPIPADGSPT